MENRHTVKRRAPRSSSARPPAASAVRPAVGSLGSVSSDEDAEVLPRTSAQPSIDDVVNQYPSRDAETDTVFGVSVETIPDEQFGPSDLRCLTCFVRYADIATFPCGHVTMCELCSIQLAVQFHLKFQKKNRVAVCPLCRTVIDETRLVILPYQNRGLHMYTQAVTKAREYYIRIMRKDASAVKEFFPEYPHGETVKAIRHSLRQRELRTEAIEMGMITYSESSEDDDPSADYVEVDGVINLE